MNLKLCNSSIKLNLDVHNSLMRLITPYSGNKLYQTAFALFKCQDVSCSNRPIRCEDVPDSKRFIRYIQGSIRLILVSRYTRQHSPYLGINMYQETHTLIGVKIYQAAFALFGCQDIPGSIRLIRVSKYTRQHTPYSDVKIYQAAFALFGNQDVPGIRLIRESRCTRHSPYSGIKMYHAFALFGVKIRQAFAFFSHQVLTSLAFLRVFHVHSNLIPGNSCILKVTKFFTIQKNLEKINSGNVILSMYIINCTQLTLIGPM